METAAAACAYLALTRRSNRTRPGVAVCAFNTSNVLTFICVRKFSHAMKMTCPSGRICISRHMCTHVVHGLHIVLVEQHSHRQTADRNPQIYGCGTPSCVRLLHISDKKSKSLCASGVELFRSKVYLILCKTPQLVRVTRGTFCARDK